MLIALGDVYAQAAAVQAVRELMVIAAEAAAREPGCEAYSFAEVVGDAAHFVTVQRWHDQGALDAHYGSAAFADYQERITPLLARSSELRVYSVADAYAPSNGGPLGAPEVD
jgi:quinol monooxygenase YgiN